MKKLIPYALVPLLIFTAGCTRKVIFTQQIREKAEHYKLDLRQVQFYIDRKVVIKRELDLNEAAGISGGKIVIENGKAINEVKIKKHTPGICENYGTDSLTISFEAGNGKSFIFGTRKYKEAPPSDFYIMYSHPGEVHNAEITYEGKTFYIEEGTDAGLCIRRDEIFKYDKTKHIVKGRKIKR